MMPKQYILVEVTYKTHLKQIKIKIYYLSFPVAQIVEHGASNAMIMGSFPRESKS